MSFWSQYEPKQVRATLAVGAFLHIMVCVYVGLTDDTELNVAAVLIFIGTGIVYIFIPYLYSYLNNNIFSPINIVSFSFYMHFCLTAVFYNDPLFYKSQANFEVAYQAMVIVTLFYLLFCLGLAFLESWSPAFGKTTRRRVRKFNDVAPNTLILLITLIIAIGVCARIFVIYHGEYFQMTTAVHGFSTMPAVGLVRFAEKLPDFAIVMLTSWIARGQKNNYKLIVIVLILLNLVYWMPTGKKYFIILSLFLPLVVFYMSRRLLPSPKYLAVAVILVVILFPVSHVYRTAQYEALGEARGLVTGEQFFETISSGVTNAQAVQDVGSQGRVLGRLNQVEPVAGAIVLARDRSELRYGEDYANIFLNLVPRAVWPNKPQVFYGNDFGRAAFMLNPNDLSTSISVTLPGEAVLNFGYLGVFAGFGLGLLVSGLIRVSESLTPVSLRPAVYTGFIPFLIYPGASAALYISAAIQLACFLVLLCRISTVRLR